MMEKTRRQTVLLAYIWQYRCVACMSAVNVCIFAVIFYLYHLETEAVWYAAALCTILTVSVLSVHFYFYRKRHLAWLDIMENIEITDDALPKPKTLPEADAQEVIHRLKHIFDTKQTDWQQERQERIDYYTTWVHQIKTPISVMRMTLQAEDTKENRELLAQLFRIERYVEMALSYLRLGSESSDFVFQEYRLDDIIRQAVHKYAFQFVRKRIRLSYEPTGQTVLTDEKWLLFLIEQILSNAVKYTQEGEVRITMPEEKVLQIADTGIGIAPEDLPRIFEKGFTGYNGRADKKSTGLGLYLCRMTADKLSHQIRVESEVGKGTAFLIDFHTEELTMI